MDGWMGGWIDGSIVMWMDGWMDGWIVVWMDGYNGTATYSGHVMPKMIMMLYFLNRKKRELSSWLFIFIQLFISKFFYCRVGSRSLQGGGCKHIEVDISCEAQPRMYERRRREVSEHRLREAMLGGAGSCSPGKFFEKSSPFPAFLWILDRWKFIYIYLIYIYLSTAYQKIFGKIKLCFQTHLPGMINFFEMCSRPME